MTFAHERKNNFLIKNSKSVSLFLFKDLVSIERPSSFLLGKQIFNDSNLPMLFTDITPSAFDTLIRLIKSENTHHRGKNHWTADLLFIWLGFSLCWISNIFTCLVESKPVKQEVSWLNIAKTELTVLAKFDRKKALEKSDLNYPIESTNLIFNNSVRFRCGVYTAIFTLQKQGCD